MPQIHLSGSFLYSDKCNSLLFFFAVLHHPELDALEADMGAETESDAMPSYLQPDKEHDLQPELDLPAAPSGHAAAAPPARQNAQAPLIISKPPIVDLNSAVTGH